MFGNPLRMTKLHLECGYFNIAWVSFTITIIKPMCSISFFYCFVYKNGKQAHQTRKEKLNSISERHQKKISKRRTEKIRGTKSTKCIVVLGTKTHCNFGMKMLKKNLFKKKNTLRISHKSYLGCEKWGK